MLHNFFFFFISCLGVFVLDIVEKEHSFYFRATLQVNHHLAIGGFLPSWIHGLASRRAFVAVANWPLDMQLGGVFVRVQQKCVCMPPSCKSTIELCNLERGQHVCFCRGVFCTSHILIANPLFFQQLEEADVCFVVGLVCRSNPLTYKWDAFVFFFL